MKPHHRIFEAAYLEPCRRGRGRLSRLFTSYALRDGRGRAIGGWPLLVSLDTSFAVNRPGRPDHGATDLPAAIYGGMFFDWFGHFIIETVPNLLAVADLKRAHPELPILFHLPDFWFPDPEARPQSLPFHDLFLDRIGLDRGDFRFVRAPLRVASLLVPDSPFPGKYRYKSWVLDRMDALFAAQPGPAAKVYFSRSRWPKPRITDEPAIEARFRAADYDIVHPQDLSLQDQLALVSRARSIAGPQGTALHWSLYAPRCRSVISMGWHSPQQRGICASRGQLCLDPKGKRPRGGDLRLRAIAPAVVERAILQAEAALGP